ncbi:MAG: winged helix-turn-helix domain-containing protein [Luteimonas sp.]
MTPAIATPWPAETRYLRIDDLTVDLRYRHLRHAQGEAELPQRVFDLLVLLLAEPRTLHTRASLFERLWPASVVEDANLTQSIWLLRKALGHHKDWVHTVAKGGYVFEPPSPVDWFAELPETMAAPGMISALPAPAAAATHARAAGLGSVRDAPLDEGVAPTTLVSADGSASRRGGLAGYWKSVVAVAALLAFIAIAGFWLRTDPTRIEPAPVPPPPLTVALIMVEDRGAPAQWPVKLLYGWLNWKLASLPEVTVLNEAELAAGMGSTPAQVVFLASGDAPDASGRLQLRARFQQAGREQQIEQTGTPAQMPALVDALSGQIMQRLLPARTGPWPRLEVDARAARRYADATEAMERRDWMAAAAIGEDVVKLAPRFGLARLQLARAQSRLAQAAQAVEHMDAARDLLQPAPPEVTELLDAQRLAVNPQQYQQAAEAYGKLATRYPDKTGYAIDYASLLVSIGRPQQALALMQANDKKQAPIGARIGRLLTMAEIYQALGDPEQMRQNARAAERLARDAGAGWELESGTALLMTASADTIQLGPRAGNALYEQAARQFDKAGNGTAALYARFLAEVSGPAMPGVGPRLDTLLAQANAGGYRELEINILFHLANQHQLAGDLPGYRRRLEQAAGIAQSAGDTMALTRLDMLLLTEDLMTARMASADQRVQRLRRAGLEGGLALIVEQLDSAVATVRGNRAQALQALDRAQRALPAVKPGEPLSEAHANLYCVFAETRLPMGELSTARADIKRCAVASDPSTQLLVLVNRAAADQLAGDRVEARKQLHRVETLLPDQGEGPDRWLLTLEIARLMTRLGDGAESDTLYQSLPAAIRATGYTLLTALLDTGLAENAAARGDWPASQRFVEAAREGLPADTWIVHSRLQLLDIAAALAVGDRAHAGTIAGRLHAQAHRLGDVVVQMEVHSLLPVGSFEDDSLAHRETLTARTGMRGATLEWMNAGGVRSVLKPAGTAR